MNTHTHSLSTTIIQENKIAQYKGRGNSLNSESALIIYYLYKVTMVNKYTWKHQVSYLANFTTPSHLRVITKISFPKSGMHALTHVCFCTSQLNLVLPARQVGDLTRVSHARIRTNGRTSPKNAFEWWASTSSHELPPAPNNQHLHPSTTTPFTPTRWVGDSPESPPMTSPEHWVDSPMSLTNTSGNLLPALSSKT